MVADKLGRVKLCNKVREVYGRVLHICLQQDEPQSYDILEQLQAVHDVFAPLALLNAFSIREEISLDDLRAEMKGVVRSATLMSWITVMYEKGRLPYIAGSVQVCKGYWVRGREPLYIESANDLSESLKAELLEFSKEKMGAHEGVHCVVNPNLLAGVRLRKGWHEIDLSLQFCILHSKEVF